VSKSPQKIVTSEALPDLLLLRSRLRAEGETDLLQKIEKCQQPIILRCLTCERRKTTVQWCKRKWCPCCAKRSAAARAMELDFIVERFRWPLFVTLTMKNCAELLPSDVRKLRRAFGKLRHRKLWKSRVRGGLAAVEITNIGNGWHPHLHAVLDCQWLAWKTPMPRRTDTREGKKKLYQDAACELESTWSKLLGQETSSVRVKRADKKTIAKEVTKYTVKNEDLVLAEGSIGTLIRALDSCRLMTTFGRAHGQCVKDVRLAAKADAKSRRETALEERNHEWCCPDPKFMPDSGLTLVEGMKTRAFHLSCESQIRPEKQKSEITPLKNRLKIGITSPA
jgi:hypothetical protein